MESLRFPPIVLVSASRRNYAVHLMANALYPLHLCVVNLFPHWSECYCSNPFKFYLRTHSHYTPAQILCHRSHAHTHDPSHEGSRSPLPISFPWSSVTGLRARLRDQLRVSDSVMQTRYLRIVPTG